MAKKPSSKKKSKRPVEQSSAKGGGIMSIDKSRTTPFMKAVLIIVIIAMVSLFLYGGIASFVDLFKPAPQPAKVDSLTALKNKYDPQIKSFDAVLASNPTSFTLLVAAAQRHYDYAAELTQLISQNSTAAMLPAGEQWTAARDTYAKAVKANKQPGSSVLVDYSVTIFYSGDATEAVKVASGVVKKDPTFAPAYYNLGIFYQAMSQPVLALAAFQKYLELDPKGTTGNADFAKQQIKALGGSVAATGSFVPTGSAPTTP